MPLPRGARLKVLWWRKATFAALGVTLALLVIIQSLPLLRSFWADLSERFLPKWRLTSLSHATAVDGLTFLRLSLARGSANFQCSLVRFHESDFELIVIDNGPSRASPRYRNLQEAMQQSGCVAGSNGGFFDIATFEPNGLMISKGQSIGRFDRSNWAEGVLTVRNGPPELASQAKFSPEESITHLLQTGPWLVQNGKPRNDFADDSATNPRTFIATDGAGTWLLGHASGSTLRDLSSILCCDGMKQILSVREALNLDGGPSSGYWVQSGREQICYIEESTVVRNFIGIQKRLPKPRREE